MVTWIIHALVLLFVYILPFSQSVLYNARDYLLWRIWNGWHAVKLVSYLAARWTRNPHWPVGLRDAHAYAQEDDLTKIGVYMHDNKGGK